MFCQQMSGLVCAAVMLTSSAVLAEGPITIGFPIPLFGPTAVCGEPILKGAEMAVAEINAKGGVPGRKLEILAATAKPTATKRCVSPVS